MRHTRTRQISYACALVLGASLVSGCGSSDDEQSATADTSQSTAATTGVTGTSEMPATTAAGPGGGEAIGTLVVVMVGRPGVALTSSALESAAEGIRSQLENFEDRPTVAIEGETLVITLPGSAEQDQGDVETSLGFDGGVYLRPVLDCAAVDPTGASTTADVGATTSTPADTATAETAEVVSTLDGTEVCTLGPAGGTGEVFEPDTAEARVISGTWGVTVDLRAGKEGEGVWNALAEQCFAGAETCPTRRLAIQIDGKIVSAPTVNAPTFAGSVQIAGTFTEDEAKGLAERLNAGTMPFGLVVQSVTFTPD